VVRDRKRERSESIVDAEPRKPRRHDRDTTSPRTQERAKEAGGLEDNLDLVSGRKALVVMTTQEYAGMSHPLLPIRSLLDPGTANDQMVK
jgi:hypothetical protein